eukprot:9207689-Pyramimonas_sp.AAC.1
MPSVTVPKTPASKISCESYETRRCSGANLLSPKFEPAWGPPSVSSSPTAETQRQRGVSPEGRD